jgi:hypothetical protein
MTERLSTTPTAVLALIEELALAKSDAMRNAKLAVSFKAERDNLKIEHEEQSRLLGISGSREAADLALMREALDALGTCRIMAQDIAGNYTREVTPKVVVDAVVKLRARLGGV